MEEKIKIYVTEDVNNILLKDMERFEFYKKDGSFNKNEFYNTLISNYYEQYQENKSNLFSHIKNTISDNANLSDIIVNNISTKIIDYIDIKANQLEKKKSDVTISMKPTKKSSDDIEFIQNYYLGNSTLSNYFRNMFASYTLLPQDKRERIIFKKNFELLEKAIKEDRKIYFTTSGKDSVHIASPYSICNSKEELFNYLLADYKDYPFSFRVGRLRKITILNEPREFLDRNIYYFKKMAEQGPQYTYSVNKDNKEIKVELTERGKYLYKSIYLHRPRYTKIENNIYYFECSKQQAFQYFSRFGKDAFVLEPKELVNELSEFYGMAIKRYSK